MLLKSLEMQGFKTFPDKTKLSFNRGMTSVVGPNGSGKSNISDAIRWVLGEQAPKSLRCTKMEDVVFSGTDKRKAQGYAEVTLTIDNKDRVLPFDGDDVAVTRRYYRSGESEYLINKASVRLKDIHELFMDTGLGRDGYSMISQGKIDSIVASKSEDRREIFEEAAGISRYRYRKSEAEKKLNNTEENLIRLRDIVKELEDRVGPLETQSKKAEKFLEYAGEKQGLEIALWLDTLNSSSQTLKEQEDKIDLAKAQYQEILFKMNQFSKENEEMYLMKGQYQSRIEEIRSEIDTLTGDISDKRSSINVTKNDIEHNNENILRIKQDIDNAKNASLDIQKEIEEKEAKIANLEEVVNKNKRDLDETNEKLANVNINSTNSTIEIQDLTTKIAQLTQGQADARVLVSSSQTSISELEERISNLRDNLSSKKSVLDDTTSMQKDYEEKVSNSREKVTKLTNDITELENTVASKLKEKEEAKASYDKKSLECEEKKHKAKILQDLAANYEGYYESVKKVMKEANSGQIHGIHGPISQLITVPTEYNIAIETALGNKMQNIITTTDDDAKAAIRMLKSTNSGRATFLPANTVKSRVFTETGLESYNGYIGVADKLCSCEEKYKNALSHLLGQIVIVDTLENAITLAKNYNFRFKVVTLDGQVVNTGGSFTGGSLAKNSGLLSRETDIKNLLSEAELLDKELLELQEKVDNADKAHKEADSKIFEARNTLSTAQQEYARIQAEYNACINEVSNITQDINAIEEEINSSTVKIEEANKAKEAAQLSLDRYNQDIENNENKVRELTGSQEDLFSERDRLSLALQEIKLILVTFTKDIETLNSEIEFAKSSTIEREAHINTLVEQCTTIENVNKELEDKITLLGNELSHVQEKIDSKNKEIVDANNSINELESRDVEIRRQESEVTDQREILSNEVSRLEERKISLQKEFDNIISKLWDEYELTKREAEAQAIEIEDLSAAKSRLAELKSKIKGLGNVNVGAIEEYKEVSTRYAEMKVQVDDVENAKKEILSLITDLTKQMQDTFVESFADINKNFAETFRDLFGGGKAALELTDPEDILNSGIDIIVHPPGKIVRHLEALSGGEKALVAIALYFAIMKVRPAPFCVMDEIEAALDEVNVDRFAHYVRNLCDDTQFILITHRRGTMEEADVLYGVTMQDEGISKLLELKATEVAEKLGVKAN